MHRFLPILLLLTIARAEVPDIDAKTRSRLGIVTADLAALDLPPSSPAFATVLDPAPLVALLRQAQSAKQTVDFSQHALDRADKLFSEGNLVPQKTVEAAHAQLLTDKAAHQTILDSILATYGEVSSSIEKPEDLLLTKQVLVRISTQASPASEPIAISILTKPPIMGKSLTRAPVADPVFQNISWLAIADGGKLVPGMTIPATLTLPGDPEKGHLLPASAVVWHLGIPWVFHEEKEGKFERIPAPDQRPVEGGWFVAGEDFPVKAIVTSGAQLLLSSEISQPEKE